MSAGAGGSITEAGVIGMTLASDHADAESAGWSDRAYAALLAAAHAMGGSFTIEQARARCVVDAPPDGRAWGAVVNRAARAGVILKTGRFASATSSHGSPKPLWVVRSVDL